MRDLPSQKREERPESLTFVIDGSNLAFEGGRALYGEKICSLVMLREAVRELESRFSAASIIVVVDASFRHRVHVTEREAVEDALRSGELSQPPAGGLGAGDALLLQIADSTGAIVVTNDSFNKAGETFLASYPWLKEQSRVLGHNYIDGVGWIFTPRQLH